MKDNIIIDQGKFGKIDYDNNDIGIGMYVICLENPKGGRYNYVERVSYYISGMGGVEYNKYIKKYQTGYGKRGYSLTRNVYGNDLEYPLSYKTEITYILHDDLIRNFIYSNDHYEDPTLFDKLKRDRTIEHVLE